VEGQRVSRNGRCGSNGSGATCLNSQWGDCCSQYSYCGSTNAYCGTGCQTPFGLCNGGLPSHRSSVSGSPSSTRTPPSTSPSQQPVSRNARCGAGFGGQTCYGSQWGDCCSKQFYCGSTDDFCRSDSCQIGYGKCNSGSSPLPSSSKRSSTSYSSA
ncbi:hypothetical protein BKA66DRAFT_501975, partial [Pyrenochaeta sp. MPI-SDFR-AT-0127]